MRTLPPRTTVHPPPEPQFTTPHEPQFTHNNKVIKTNNKNNLNINTEQSSVYSQTNIFGEKEVEHQRSKKTKVNKRAGSGKKVESKVVTARQRIIDFWLKELHPNWTFNATDGTKINSLIKKLTKSLQENGNEVTDDNLVNLFKTFCVKLDGFYSNETLSVLDSKYHTIIERIKNNNNGKSNHQIESNRNFFESINAFAHFDEPAGFSCEDNL